MLPGGYCALEQRFPANRSATDQVPAGRTVPIEKLIIYARNRKKPTEFVIGLDSDLARTAGDLAEVHGLRGYDAVHLATALSIDVDPLLLATWDGDLGRAPLAAGCSLSPPPSHQ